MIKIKELLFELLEKIRPNELLRINIGASYDSIVICNKESLFPLASELKTIDSYDREFFRENPYVNNDYVDSHTIEMNDVSYLICEEILYVEFCDKHFVIITTNPERTQETYVNYDSIRTITRFNNKMNDILNEYNALNYQLKKQ